MGIPNELLAVAEQLFDRHGYTATGVDRLTEAAGMSSRTLYKHAGSKAQLVGQVLDTRGRRFMERMTVDSVDALFAVLEKWIRLEGARGCLFLRVFAETGGDTPEVVEALASHKAAFRQRVEEIVAKDLGHADMALVEQVLVLLEGSTHAAVYRGDRAVAAGRAAAAILVERARM